MSGNYTVRQRAKDDVMSIWFYTVERWGTERANSYLRKIRDKFEWLAENPRAGTQRKDVDPELYATPVGMHIVLYDIVNNQPDIVAVIHQSADIKRKLRQQE
ncbi:type II toxin-antitoxin system RelE/ParE family toxin [Endozoicomonas sp. ONNA1]|uniref:type II toxin-antitoxin system RelE/ParE family toxin n=1 Tax=Endozoicomonas sp. ONNA1 TaxID=2828740 RepID=UPI0021498D56|nr:type II toxin-antitoxin system RelE/ParE family toxin [Endozoicomonas sp. ONNA1]